jgi:Uma2 family endonuclease
MVAQEKIYTDEDLLRLTSEGKRFELVKGALVPMSPTGDEQGIVAMWFGYLIMNFVVEHGLGDVTAAETGFVLVAEPRTVRAPDVGFIAKERLPELTGGFYQIAPDLAVEVVSPSDNAKEIRAKVNDYLEAGTRLV